MVTNTDIKSWIEVNLPNSRVTVTGDGKHFEAIVICDDFAGKNILERHRIVYTALGHRMQSQIHALSLRTLTTDEFK